MTPAPSFRPQPRNAAWRATTLLVIVFAASLAGQGCAPGGGGGTGPGHRSQHLGLSPQKEYELGQKAYQQVLDDAEKKHVLLGENSAEVRRVQRVGKRIVQAVEIEPLQREINLHVKGYRFKWQYNVIRSKQVNAFCMPAGGIVVYSALLSIVENDDQLATVLSHEIAHALAHHSNERITEEQSGRVNWLMRMSYDRQQESEADHIGLFLMTFAGYNPDEALIFWQHMARLSRGGQLPEILSNHPSDQRRIQQMRAWVPQVKAAKIAFDHHRVAASR